jgi:hypothetical protein
MKEKEKNMNFLFPVRSFIVWLVGWLVGWLVLVIGDWFGWY